jgi:membrane peptidoglycan carboxypeptidase
MSEHRRKQPGQGDPAGGGQSRRPSQGRGVPPGGSPQGPPPRRTAAQPQLTRAEMRKAAQSKGRRGGKGGRGPGGPTGPKPKRFIDYPRWGKTGVRRWLPSWKQMLSGFLMLTAGLVGVVGIAFAETQIPDQNTMTSLQSNTYYWSNGQVMVQQGAAIRQNVPLSSVPVKVQDDFLAAENATFWSDPGVDPEGILRAFYDMAKGEGVQSGSTITQQWIKNTRLNQSQTISRKLQEILISVKVGAKVPKEQVLDGYLNTSYFGRGTYGIQAAAQAYYGVSAPNLTISQGAVLASLLNGPSAYDPTFDPNTGIDTNTVNQANLTALKARWTYVLTRMGADGFITPAQSQAALAGPFPMPIKYTSSTNLGGYIGYLYTLANNNLLRSGVTQQQLSAGGYQIYTTFNQTDMNDMKSAVDNELLNKIKSYSKDKVTDTEDPSTAPDYGKSYPVNQWVHAGGASVDPSSGAVRAIYGGPDFEQQQIDDADNPGILVGSTFKAFVLAAALTDGLAPTNNGSTAVAGQPVSLNSLFNGDPNLVIKQPNGSPWLDQSGNTWTQANDSTTKWGPVTLTEAMAQSINTVYVQLGMDVGMPKVAAAATAAGVLPSSLADDNVPSFALGTSTPGPIRLATAYATFDDGGIEHDPYEVDHYVYNGQTTSLKSKPVVAFSPEVADTVTTALKAVVSPTGTGANALALGHDAAGKTGTTDSYKSAWFVGFTKQVSTAIGLFDQDPTNSSLVPLIGLGGEQQVYGANFPTAIWTNYMEQVLNGQPNLPLATANYGTVQDEAGQSPSASASASQSASSPASSHPSHTPSTPASPSQTSSASCSPIDYIDGTCTSPSGSPTDTSSGSPSDTPSDPSSSSPGGRGWGGGSGGGGGGSGAGGAIG